MLPAPKCAPLSSTSLPQKHRMGLFIRTIGIERAKAKTGLANIAFNFKRFLYWETRASTA